MSIFLRGTTKLNHLPQLLDKFMLTLPHKGTQIWSVIDFLGFNMDNYPSLARNKPDRDRS